MADTTLVDPLGRTFVLADRIWQRHIIIGHPDVGAHRHLVEQAVTSLLCIRTSSSSTDCRKCFGTGPRSSVFIAVVVDVSLGIVKTAYLSKPMTSGDLEWQP